MLYLEGGEAEQMLIEIKGIHILWVEVMLRLIASITEQVLALLRGQANKGVSL
jgi:hypothetical protein